MDLKVLPNRKISQMEYPEALKFVEEMRGRRHIKRSRPVSVAKRGVKVKVKKVYTAEQQAVINALPAETREFMEKHGQI